MSRIKELKQKIDYSSSMSAIKILLLIHQATFLLQIFGCISETGEFGSNFCSAGQCEGVVSDEGIIK